MSDRASIANAWTLDASLFGEGIDALATGTLVVEGMKEGAIAVESDPLDAASFHIDVLDAAFAFGELFMFAGLDSGLWREQRALEALSAKAIGVLELRGGIHRQAKRAEWGSIGEARKRRFGRLPEGNSSHASMTSSGFIHVPGIRSRIANDVGRKLLESQDRLMGERAKKRDIVGVEGLSVFSKHDGSILGDDGGSDAGAVAPEEFFLLFGRTVGLLLVGAALDAQPAIRITCQAGLLALVLL